MSRKRGERLDLTLVRRQLADTRSRARALIMAGDIVVNGEVVLVAGRQVDDTDEIVMRERPRFVSRGGEKLATALELFDVHPVGLVCADIGASTGGFTDCLLKAGAKRVYAVDVGYGQLAESLRLDPRVVVLDRTNVRYLETLPEPVSLVVVDVSFISLALVFPSVARISSAEGQCIALIKPQFEAGRKDVGKGGVVRDSAVHRRVLERIAGAALGSGYSLVNLIRSPLLGPAGNAEFLGLFLRSDADKEIGSMIDSVLGGRS